MTSSCLKMTRLPLNDHSVFNCIKCVTIISNITPGRRQSQTVIPSTNVDQKSLETEFSNAICRSIGDKCQSKTLFLTIFDPRSSIAKSVFDCRLPGVNIVCAYRFNKLFLGPAKRGWQSSIYCLTSIDYF